MCTEYYLKSVILFSQPFYCHKYIVKENEKWITNIRNVLNMETHISKYFFHFVGQ